MKVKEANEKGLIQIGKKVKTNGSSSGTDTYFEGIIGDVKSEEFWVFNNSMNGSRSERLAGNSYKLNFSWVINRNNDIADIEFLEDSPIEVKGGVKKEMERKFYVGDKLKWIDDYSSYKKGDIFIVKDISSDSGGFYVTNPSGNSHYETHFELITGGSIFENKMEKKVFSVLIIDKKTAKETKNENVVAEDKQDALLKAFGVEAENLFIKIDEVAKYDVKEQLSAVLVKEEKKKE